MTDRELLISLHQKVDRNHEWMKRQLSDILSYMAHMHTSVKKVHQYAHHTYQHLDALMKEVMLPQYIEKLGLQRPQLSSIRPKTILALHHSSSGYGFIFSQSRDDCRRS